MNWPKEVVRELASLKRAQLPFDDAWRIALERHPPLQADRGPLRPTLLESEESVVEFTRRVCRKAWHDEIRTPLSADLMA